LKLLHGRFKALPVSDDGHRKPNCTPQHQKNIQYKEPIKPAFPWGFKVF
jgi:hypothetical protein